MLTLHMRTNYEACRLEWKKNSIGLVSTISVRCTDYRTNIQSSGTAETTSARLQ